MSGNKKLTECRKAFINIKLPIKPFFGKNYGITYSFQQNDSPRFTD